MQNIITIDGDAITVTPSEEHVFLLDTKLVAQGFGVSPDAIRMCKQRNADELVEGKHWIIVENPELTGVTDCYARRESTTSATSGLNRGNPTLTAWTKRGVIRLGFFIGSDRARRFRDLAEDWVLERLEGASPVAASGETVSREIMDGMCRLLDQHAQILQVMADHAAGQGRIVELLERLVPRRKPADPRAQPRIYAGENDRVCRLLAALIDTHADAATPDRASFRARDIYSMAAQIGEFAGWIGDHPEEYQRTNKLMVNLRKFFNRPLIGPRHIFTFQYARKARHRYYTVSRAERMSCLQRPDDQPAVSSFA
ncbi:MAG: hypothetical protein LBO05_04165 [Deltaproteobacteria bacterium]|jgi:hypothetical protein|nr:hypothetical protein [Deltaproteobacteria bacterium]